MASSNSDFIPVLQTERLLLRQLRSTDDVAIFRIRSSEEVYRYIAQETQKHISEAQDFIKKTITGIIQEELLYWVIVLKETDELVGNICFWNFSDDRLTGEIGYQLHPDFHRQGIMNEAIAKVINFGFSNLRLHTIEAFTHKDNVGSRSLLSGHGFKLVADRTDKDYPDNLIYVLKE